jgi:hypothetical protein
MKFLTSLCAVAGLASAATVQPRQVSYEGYKVVRLPVGTDASKVSDIVSSLKLSTWGGAPKAGRYADLVVPPAQLGAFNAAIAGMDDVVTMHEDLGASIAAESAFAATDFSTAAVNATWFNSYHSYADHLSWLSSLQAQYPSQSEIVSSGNSLQGNAITGIHFWGSSGKGKRPAVVIHGTVHAREWISTMVVEYEAYNLLTNYASNSEIKGFVDKYDFYFFPVVNPDGTCFFPYSLTYVCLTPQQGSSTARPTTECGARTARPPRAPAVSATTSTATGRSCGPCPAVHRLTPAPRTSRAGRPVTPPSSKLSPHTWPKSSPPKVSNYSWTCTRTASFL